MGNKNRVFGQVLEISAGLSGDSESLRSLWRGDSPLGFMNPRMPDEEREVLLKGLHRGFLWGHENGISWKNHLFFLTSGSSSQGASSRKWIALNREAFLVSARAVNQAISNDVSQWDRLGRDGLPDRWLHLLPDFHVGGLAIRARCFASGAGCIDQPTWDVSTFLSALERECITRVSLVPTQVYDLCQMQARCPSSLRTVLVGAGALSAECLSEAVALGWPIRTTYAMTEAASSIALSQPLGGVLAEGQSQGAPDEFELLGHFEAQVRDEVLWLRGASLLSASLSVGEESQSSLASSGVGPVVDPKVQGWLKTSDRVQLQGRTLRFLGRLGEVVKIGGEKVDVVELRKTLDQVRSQLRISADLALLAVPDTRLGHAIHLVVSEGVGSDQVEQLCREFQKRVLPYEKIRKIHHWPEIPRSSLGKLLGAECLARIRESELTS